MIQRMLAIWPLVPLAFLKSAWTPGSYGFMCCWSLFCETCFVAPYVVDWVNVLCALGKNALVECSRTVNWVKLVDSIFQVFHVLADFLYQMLSKDIEISMYNCGFVSFTWSSFNCSTVLYCYQRKFMVILIIFPFIITHLFFLCRPSHSFYVICLFPLLCLMLGFLSIISVEQFHFDVLV